MAQETRLPTPEELQNFSWLLDCWATGMVSAVEGMGCPAPAVEVGSEPQLSSPASPAAISPLSPGPAAAAPPDAAAEPEPVESAAVEPSLSPGDSSPASDIKGFWAQSFTLLAAHCVWVGASPTAQRQIGGQALQAAGIEDPEDNDSHDTYRELVVQSMGALAAQLTSRCGREVTPLAGTSVPGEPGTAAIRRVVKFRTEGIEPFSITFVASMELLQQLVRDGFYRKSGWKAHDERTKDRLGERRPRRDSETQPAAGRAEPASLPFDSVLDMDIPVSISFGSARLRLDEALKLKEGSIVALGRTIDEPVELQVNGRMVARGEMVAVRGRYGIRILELTSRGERLGHIDPQHRTELEGAGLS